MECVCLWCAVEISAVPDVDIGSKSGPEHSEGFLVWKLELRHGQACELVSGVRMTVERDLDVRIRPKPFWVMVFPARVGIANCFTLDRIDLEMMSTEQALYEASNWNDLLQYPSASYAIYLRSWI